MQRAQDLNPAIPWAEVSLVLTDDRSITDINRQYFNKDEPTDVIAFAYEPLPGTDGHAGEIFVNAERAHSEGLQRGSCSRELAFYMAHGCLHLTGADDATPQQRETMFSRQDKWLAEAEDLGLLGSLFVRAEDQDT